MVPALLAERYRAMRALTGTTPDGAGGGGFNLPFHFPQQGRRGDYDIAAQQRGSCERSQQVRATASQSATSSGSEGCTQRRHLSSSDLPTSVAVVGQQASSPHASTHSAEDDDDVDDDEEEEEEGEEEDMEREDELLRNFERQRDVVMLSPRRELPAEGSSTSQDNATPLTTQSVQAPDSGTSTAATDAKQPPGAQQQPEAPVFETIVAKCGLTMPPEEQKTSAHLHAASIDFQGRDQKAEAPKKARAGKLPVARGFQEALQSTWETHSQPPKIDLYIDMAGASELGICSIPPVDPTLAQCFASQHSKTDKNPYSLSGTKPTFSDKKEKEAFAAANHVYSSIGLAIRSHNAAVLAAGAMTAAFREHQHRLPKEVAEEMEKYASTAALLNCHTTQWMGKALEILATQERKRWLQYVSFQRAAGPDPKTHLTALPYTPDTLFKGGVEFLQLSSESRKTQQEMVSSVMEPPPATSSSSRHNPRRSSRSGDRGRSSSRKADYRSTKAPSASPAPSRPRHEQKDAGRPADNRQPPHKSTSRYVKPRRGRQGK